MELKLLPLAVCRTPAFSYEQDLASVWDDLKAAIRESSRHFYKEIAHIEASQLNELPPKIKFTVWKYYNRSVYRATPFGSFASFTVVPVKNEGTFGRIWLQDQPIRHVFVDWSEKEQLFHQQITSLQRVRYLISNSSAYTGNHEIRFISKDGESFSITSVEAVPIILDSLNYCQNKRSIASLYNWYQQKHGLSPSQAEELLIQLIDLQLIFTDLHPNITGDDYFNRIGHHPVPKSQPYTMTERKVIGGTISHPSLSQLTEAIQFLSRNLPVLPQPSLTNFKTAFLKKFEYYEVPLMVALDPQLGVGYGELEINTDEGQPVFDLKKMRVGGSSIPSLRYSDLHQFLLQQWHKQTIRLEDYAGKATDHPGNTLPNTLSAIVRFYGNQLLMEEAGGPTATSLLGRFTLVSASLEQFGKELAALESTANPDILFFDIAYQAEKNADNVNRRKSLYPYELYIHSWCGDALPLPLNDLMVSVQQGEVVLRSIKYGKRAIPRLASAYNYNRANLSVYRFLCDLQHQGLNTALTLDPAHFFPGADHYPRIQYKDVILSPAKWKVPPLLTSAQFREWLEKQEINRFTCGQGDQTLCFQSDMNEDLEAFLQFSKKHPDLYISEGLVADKSFVANECGQPKVAEFVFHFHHTSTIYKAAPVLIPQYTQLQEKREAWCLPGNQWLYFEIYGHPYRSNDLLNHEIVPFIQAQQARLKSWFFIRYDQSGPHIRLRLQLIQKEDGYHMMEAFSRCLEPALREGTISDLQIKPYLRETERYHSVDITDTEALFSFDSMYAVHLIGQQQSTHVLYDLTLSLMEIVLHDVGIPLSGQLAYVSGSIDHFNQELKVGTNLFKRINQSYQTFKRQQKMENADQVLVRFTRQLAANYLALLGKCPGIFKLSFMADLFHLHINRLFPTDQRSHEQMIYHFLYTMLKEKAYSHRPLSVSKVLSHDSDPKDLIHI